MYDISRLRPTNKETAVAILIVTVMLVVIFCTGYMLGLRNADTGTGGENLHDNGDTAAWVRTEIDAAGSSVSTAKSRIDNAAAAADRELATLRNELSISKEQLTKAEDSLRNANLYLEKCAAEEKKTRLKIKAQRNTWAAVAACLVVALAVK